MPSSSGSSSFLLWLLDHKDEGTVISENIRNHSSNNTASHPRQIFRITTVTTPNERSCCHTIFGHQIMGAPVSGIHSFIPLACAECDDSLPFSGASSIPLCYVLFPATLQHQLFFHPPSLHLTIYFLVYLSTLFFPNSYIILFREFYFLPFSVQAQTNVIYLTLLSLLQWVF